MRCSTPRSGLSSRISENERIEVRGVLQLVADGRDELVLQAVELGQALIGAPQLLARGLERLRLLLQLAAVLDHLRGLVEDRHDLVGAEIGALDHGRDHHPGRGRADRAGQQALGEVDQIGIGLGALRERQAAHARMPGERLLGALRADVARRAAP